VPSPARDEAESKPPISLPWARAALPLIALSMWVVPAGKNSTWEFTLGIQMSTADLDSAISLNLTWAGDIIS